MLVLAALKDRASRNRVELAAHGPVRAHALVQLNGVIDHFFGLARESDFAHGNQRKAKAAAGPRRIENVRIRAAPGKYAPPDVISARLKRHVNTEATTLRERLEHRFPQKLRA